MTRERAKELAPIISAYAEGKTIEVHYERGWFTAVDPCWDGSSSYRIKPEPRMRPMTHGEVLYKVTTTPGMVVRDRPEDNWPIPASACNFSYEKADPFLAGMEWAIIDASGNTGEWHKFEVEE